ncbi:unnamed protein product [Allacma fusca]|uniref:CRAL-TRIO domain-containing protein n=1 Tax=Allacma fusca TaxID=39272 RepID=A0A8J2PU90_9HEXA|nr:unnamed protein product [Allacma fusca]
MFFPVIILALASLSFAQNELVETSTELVSKDLPPETENEISEVTCRKIYSYTKATKLFKNFTYEETKAFVNEISSWDDPIRLSELFPYYHAGYDYEKKPVWILEVGKFNFRRIIEQGEENVLIGHKYMLQMIINMMKSTVAKDSPGDEIRDGMIILDMQDFNLSQVTFLPFWAEFVKIAGKMGDLIIQVVGRVILINANFATKTAADIARPLVGRLFERVEVYGNGVEQWRSRLLKLFPPEVLPPWYGGSQNFTPVSIHG